MSSVSNLAVWTDPSQNNVKQEKKLKKQPPLVHKPVRKT